MAAERRFAKRKSVDAIHVTEMTSLSNYKELAREGYIIDASINGFLMSVSRKNLIPPELKQNLSLDSLIGERVVLFLPQMNLDLDGKITRAHHTGKGFFEIAISFSDDIPEYWRECLIDLLPSPGELEEENVD